MKTITVTNLNRKTHRRSHLVNSKYFRVVYQFQLIKIGRNFLVDLNPHHRGTEDGINDECYKKGGRKGNN